MSVRKCYLPLTKTTHFPCTRSCNRDNQRLMLSTKNITLNKRLPFTFALGLFVGHLNGKSKIRLRHQYVLDVQPHLKSELRWLPRVLRPRASWTLVWREILNPREVHAKNKNKDGFPFPRYRPVKV